jgi:hypothetical protein
MTASPMTKLDPKSLPPLGESRNVTLRALRERLKQMERDPDPKIASAIREFVVIQQEISRIESILPEYDPISIAQQILEDEGDWIPVKRLAKTLDDRNVSAPGTRKRSDKVHERRAWTNEERLIRSLQLAVSHGRLAGFRRQENGEMCTYIGLPSFKFPVGVQKMKATRKKS